MPEPTVPNNPSDPAIPIDPNMPAVDPRGSKWSNVFRRKKGSPAAPDTTSPAAPDAGSPGGDDPTPGAENAEQTQGVNTKAESVLGRMWRGEFVSEAEKKKATGWEKTAITTGKTADTIAYALGYKTAVRLADRWAKKNARVGEVRRIKEIILIERELKERLRSATTPQEKEAIQREMNLLGAGEDEVIRITEKIEREDELKKSLESAATPAEKEAIQQEIDSLGFEKEAPRYIRIRRKMETMRKEIEISKFLSPEKKARLEEKLQALETKWITAEGDVDEQMAVEIDNVLNEHIGEKAKRMDYLKESVGLVGGALSAYSFRAVATGAISLTERYRNLKGAKTEGQKVTVKELIWDGARDMASELVGQGKISKDLSYRDKRKYKAMGAAALKSLAPAMIVWLGYTEFADRGAGALTGAIPHIGERINEINRAWQSVDNPGDAIKAVLLTMNFEETFNRTTSLFRRGHAPDAGHSEVLGKSAVSAGALTPEDTAALNTPHAEHSSAVSATEAARVAQVAEVEPTPGPITAETLKYDALKAAGAQGGTVPEAQVEPSAPAEPGETVSAPREAVAPSSTDVRGPVSGPVEAEAVADTSNNTVSESPEAVKAPAIGETQPIDPREAVASNAVSEPDSVPQKGEPLVGAEQPTSWMLNEQRIINLESSFGVNPADGITPEDVQKVAAQLQGVNAESADELLKSWQGTHPEIANSIQESRALVGLEKAFGVNSFEGQVSAEELKKVIAELAGENKENAEKLLTAWESKGLVEHDAVLAGRFPIEHPSIEHAGFQTETADAKVDIALDLGKEGAPQYLEQVFYRMALDDANIGGEITNLEGARILNVGANMTALSEGHDIAGVSAETFARYVTVLDGKLEVTNFAGFHEEVLSKLTAHAEELITAENVGNTGAVAYLDNIKNETWADMAKPEGAEVNLDQAQIDQAEGPIFKALVEDSGEHTGLAENSTDINVTAEGDGSFKIAGETPVVIDHGAITSIGDTHFDQPIPLDSDAGHAKLLEEAGKIEAQRIGANILEDSDDDLIGDQGTETDLDDDSDMLDSKTPENAVTSDNNTNDAKPAESTDSSREIPRSSLNPIPKTEIPEGMTIKATPEADQFMRQNGIRIFHGQIIGEKLPYKLDFIPEPGQVMDNGTTEAVDFKMTENGNLRVTVTDTDGSKDIQEITSAGKIINIQGAEGPGLESPGAEDTNESASSKPDTAESGPRLSTVQSLDSGQRVFLPAGETEGSFSQVLKDSGRNPDDFYYEKTPAGLMVQDKDAYAEIFFKGLSDGKEVFLNTTTEQIREKISDLGGNPKDYYFEQAGNNLVVHERAEYAEKFLNEIDKGRTVIPGDRDAVIAKIKDLGGNPEDYLIHRGTDGLTIVEANNPTVSQPEVAPTEQTPNVAESPTTPDAGATTETAGDHLETVKTSDGSTARFTYDNSGNVTRVSVEGSTSGEPGSLQDNFREQIKRAWEASGKKGDLQLNIDKVEMEASTIDLHRSVLRSMVADGQGNSPEAEFMRQQIERAIEHTEKIYGDVFKGSAVETNPVAGTESNIETPASTEDTNKALNIIVKGLRLSNMPPQVVEGMNITDIATINDSDFLQKMKMVTERVLNVVEKKTDTATEVRSLEAIIEAIDSRIGQLKA